MTDDTNMTNSTSWLQETGSLMFWVVFSGLHPSSPTASTNTSNSQGKGHGYKNKTLLNQSKWKIVNLIATKCEHTQRHDWGWWLVNVWLTDGYTWISSGSLGLLTLQPLPTIRTTSLIIFHVSFSKSLNPVPSSKGCCSKLTPLVKCFQVCLVHIQKDIWTPQTLWSKHRFMLQLINHSHSHFLKFGERFDKGSNARRSLSYRWPYKNHRGTFTAGRLGAGGQVTLKFTDGSTYCETDLGYFGKWFEGLSSLLWNFSTA